MKKHIDITYFAILRERTGLSGERVETESVTASDLYAELAGRHDLPDGARYKVAINDVFRDWSAPLEDGDRVVFIPPVAGG